LPSLLVEVARFDLRRDYPGRASFKRSRKTEARLPAGIDSNVRS